jgi:hypothetical protein
MKTKSPVFRSIGALLALVAFIALPSSLAAPCQTCCTPTCSFYYGENGGPNNTELETTYPSDAWIFYTKTLNQANNNDPCHDASGTPCPPFAPNYYVTYKVPNGTHVPLATGITHFRVLAWRSDRGDSTIQACEEQNPP